MYIIIAIDIQIIILLVITVLIFEINKSYFPFFFQCNYVKVQGQLHYFHEYIFIRKKRRFQNDITRYT